MFDVDGVLADFFTAFHKLGRDMGLYNMIPPLPDYWDWDKSEKAQKVWDEIERSKEFWAHGIEPFNELYTLDGDSQLTRINEMCYNKHEVYFVTARVSPEAKQQTELWLWNHGIDHPTVIITKLKGEFAKTVGIDYSIEDKVENAWCVAWLSKAKSYLIDRPYNQVPEGIGSSKIIRVKSVKDFLDIIDTEEVEKHGYKMR
jgi:uncharacterized HAD superfamily protein